MRKRPRADHEALQIRATLSDYFQPMARSIISFFVHPKYLECFATGLALLSMVPFFIYARALADNQDHHSGRQPLWPQRGDGLVRGQRPRLRFRAARQQEFSPPPSKTRPTISAPVARRNRRSSCAATRKRTTPPNPGRLSVASAPASKQRNWGWISATSSPTSPMARQNISTTRSIARADRWKI